MRRKLQTWPMPTLIRKGALSTHQPALTTLIPTPLSLSLTTLQPKVVTMKQAASTPSTIEDAANQEEARTTKTSNTLRHSRHLQQRAIPAQTPNLGNNSSVPAPLPQQATATLNRRNTQPAASTAETQIPESVRGQNAPCIPTPTLV